MKVNSRSIVKKAFLCLLMLLTGLLFCFLMLLTVEAYDASRRWIEMFTGFFRQDPLSIGNAVWEWFGDSTCLYICALGVLVGFFADCIPAGTIGQCALGMGVCLYAGTNSLPWWASMLFASLAGAFLGTLRGFYASKGQAPGFLAGITADMVMVLLMPFALSETSSSSFEAFPALFGKVGLEIPMALICGIGIYLLLWRTKAGLLMKAAGANGNGPVYDGVSSRLMLIGSIALSGLLTSAGAALSVLRGNGIQAFSCVSMGLLAAGTCCLSLFHPISVLFAAILLQYIVIGSRYIIDHPVAVMLPELFSSVVICVYAMRHVHLKKSRVQGDYPC